MKHTNHRATGHVGLAYHDEDLRWIKDVLAVVTELGGLVRVLEGADPADRAELYAALGVEITYQPHPRTAVLAVEPQALGQARVGGGT